MNVLLLGARSWIGFRLCEAAHSICPEWTVVGTSRCRAAAPNGFLAASTACEFSSLITERRPAVVVNLLRGEDEEGLKTHQAVIHACARVNALYCFTSSALALDSSESPDLTEDVPPSSGTPYGKFKQTCEEALAGSSDCRSLVLRFSSLQGWSPHKPSRNEVFLRKISAGQNVIVDRGVWQNRMLDTEFAQAVIDLLRVQANGIVHLGAEDSSEEFEFLRRVAMAFGWEPSLVVPGRERQVNLVTRPKRLFNLFGDRYRFTEQDTINGLLSCPQLSSFRNRAEAW